jgi:hypothetical protein
MITFLARGRSHRAITAQQVFARQVREAQAAAVHGTAVAFDASSADRPSI